MKAHLGCGTIYLNGYVNIDAAPDIMSDDPEAAEIILQNGTTFDNYYKVGFCKGSGKVVADKKALIDDLPFENDSLNEVILIQVLEHIPAYNVSKVLNETCRVLKRGGCLIVGVPDVVETAKILVNATTAEEEDWCIRLIHGTQRNKFSHHFCGYIPRTLKQLLFEHGFGDFKDLPNINFYPSFHIAAFKR